MLWIDFEFSQMLLTRLVMSISLSLSQDYTTLTYFIALILARLTRTNVPPRVAEPVVPIDVPEAGIRPIPQVTERLPGITSSRKP